MGKPVTDEALVAGPGSLVVNTKWKEESEKAKWHANKYSSLELAIKLAEHRRGLTEDPDQVRNRIIEDANVFFAYLEGTLDK